MTHKSCDVAFRGCNKCYCHTATVSWVYNWLSPRHFKKDCNQCQRIVSATTERQQTYRTSDRVVTADWRLRQRANWSQNRRFQRTSEQALQHHESVRTYVRWYFFLSTEFQQTSIVTKPRVEIARRRDGCSRRVRARRVVPYTSGAAVSTPPYIIVRQPAAVCLPPRLRWGYWPRATDRLPAAGGGGPSARPRPRSARLTIEPKASRCARHRSPADYYSRSVGGLRNAPRLGISRAIRARRETSTWCRSWRLSVRRPIAFSRRALCPVNKAHLLSSVPSVVTTAFPMKMRIQTI